MKLSDVAAALQVSFDGDDSVCNGVSIDTRTAASGFLFIALKGESYDSHDFLGQIEDRCVAAIVDRPVSLSIPTFCVPDTQAALEQLARYWREHLSQPLIALTGSCGKTTTRELLVGILKQAGQVSSSKKSHNNAIGVPLSLLQATKEDDYLVLEVGTNSKGEIAAHAALLQPSIAMITNASLAHVAGLSDLQGVVTEKGDLLTGLSAGGVAILNRDDPSVEQWIARLPKTVKVITFGLHPQSDVRATEIELKANGHMHFVLHDRSEALAVSIPLVGEHNVCNALAACAVAQALNVPHSAVVAGLMAGQFEPGRLQVMHGPLGSCVINDSYNANPASVKAAIHALKNQPGGRKILVLGDMVELGPIAPDCHAQVGEYAKSLGIDAFYGYGRECLAAVAAFGDGAVHFDSRSDLSAALLADITADTVVLVKGSNSMGMSQVVTSLCQHEEKA